MAKMASNRAISYDISSATEVGEGGSLIFTVARKGKKLVAEEVAYTVGGTADSGTDYTPPTGSVVFAAGQTTATISVVTKADAISEADETVTITLKGDTASGTITNVVPPPPPPAESSMDAAWQTLKIGAGGYITGIDIAPDGTMVMRTDTYGAYIWRADQWEQLVTAESMPADIIHGGGVYEIKIAPSDSNILYMMFSGDVYRSIDGGETWSTTSFENVAQDPNGITRTDGQKMAVDPNDPDVVYAGTENDGLFVTRNGGATWQQVADVPVSAAESWGGRPGVTGILFDPSSGVSSGTTNTIYAASWGNGIYQSTDAGATWNALPGGPSEAEYAAVDGLGNYFVVSQNQDALWKFNDAADTWTQVATGGGNDMHAVAVDPFDPNHVVVTNGGGGLMQSEDGGATWGDGWNWGNALESSNDIPWLEDSGLYMSSGGFAFDPMVQDKLWQSAGVGVWHTTLPEDLYWYVPVIWNSQSVGIEQLVTNEILVPPGGDPIMASWDRSFFVSSNFDEYPVRYDDGTGGMEFSMGWSVDYASSDPSFIVGISDWWGRELSGYSTDGGYNWQAFEGLPNDAWSTIGGSIAASTPENIIWAPANRGTPAYTLDGGQTWTDVDLPGTDDWGAFHWAYYLNRTTVTADRELLNTFYMYDTASGVYSSLDGGQNWTQVYQGEITPLSGYNAKIEAVPGSAGELFFTGGPQSDPFTLDHEPFMHSQDGGHTWEAVSNVEEVHTFGFGAPSTEGGPASVYIVGFVEEDYGIWKSTDNAESWTQIGETPMGSLDIVRTISGDPDNGNVYIGFSGSGFAYLPAQNDLLI
jgi:photosystem II stability/assembly factor-like uncharacterized protein